MSLSELLARVPTTWRYEMKSVGHTFLAASIVEAGIQWHTVGSAFPTEKGVILAILAAVIRAGVKAVFSLAFTWAKE